MQWQIPLSLHAELPLDELGDMLANPVILQFVPANRRQTLRLTFCYQGTKCTRLLHTLDKSYRTVSGLRGSYSTLAIDFVRFARTMTCGRPNPQVSIMVGTEERGPNQHPPPPKKEGVRAKGMKKKKKSDGCQTASQG